MLEIVWRNGIAQLHGTPPGQPRIRKSLRTRDPKIAEDRRLQEEARIARAAIYGPECETTFAQAAVLYLEEKGPQRYLTPLIKELGNRRIATIKPGELRALAKKLYPGSKASNMNRAVVKPARAVINYAADMGLCQPLWVKGFKEAKVIRGAGDRIWLDKFRAHAVNPRIKVLSLFMFVTGARITESMLLRPKHMDLDNKVARADLTKNGDPRIYHLTAELVAELRTLEPRVARERNGTPKTLEDGSPDLRVFGYSDRKGPLVPWKETCKGAGIRYLSPHEAGRHGFGTETIVRQKLDPVTAAKLGHWSDPTVLLKTYAHAEGLGEIAEATFGKKNTGRGTKLAHARGRRLKTMKEQKVA
jgi:integrase